MAGLWFTRISLDDFEQFGKLEQFEAWNKHTDCVTATTLRATDWLLESSIGDLLAILQLVRPKSRPNSNVSFDDETFEFV